MLKKNLLYTLVEFISLSSRAKEFISVKLLTKHLKYNVVQAGEIKKNVVIFAIYPGTTSLFSIERILKSIQKTKFSLVVVINKNRNQSDVLNLLAAYNCTVLLRSNIGRDLGAYQCGLFFLGGKPMKINLEKVALVNDSLYVTKHNQDFFENFLNSDFNCIYMNKQGTHHASSHTIILDKTALNSRDLIEFWESYFPSSSRIHAVFKGEFGLTKSLGESYFKPFVNHAQLYKHLDNYKLNNLEKSQIKIWSKRSGLNRFGLIEKYLANNQESKAINFCLENFQVSNSLGLYLYRTLKVPIKLDICRNKLVSMKSFVKLLGAEMDLSEIEMLTHTLTSSKTRNNDPVSYIISRVLYQMKRIALKIR